MGREAYSNGMTTTIVGSLSAGASSVTLATISLLPTVGQYRIEVDDEVMLVEAGTTTTRPILQRGADDTTATSHISGATARQVLTAGALDAIVSVYDDGVFVGNGRDLNFTGILVPTVDGSLIDIDASVTVATGLPGTQTIPATGTAGSMTALARSDHVHPIGNLTSIDNSLVINDSGADADFRVEGDTEPAAIWVDASGDDVYIGGSVNAVRIGKGGELSLVGSATRWEDVRIEPTARSTGANVPSFEKWYDDAGGTSRGVYLYSFDDSATEKELHFTLQLPHQWAQTSIYPHVHWVGNVAGTAQHPIWGLEYVWAEAGAIFGDTVIIYTDGVNYTLAGTAADVVAGTHYIAQFGAVAPGSLADGISSIMIGRLFRRSSDASDTYTAGGNKCGLLYSDAHIEVNDLGSRQEYVK